MATSRDGGGWTAEFRIPFRTLRFRSGSSPTFGFNVRRFIRRANEEDLWRSYGRAEGLRQLQNEGVLAGLEGLRRERGIAFLPYALLQGVETSGEVEYDFSTRMSLQSFVQYNNDSDRVDFNVRFHWIPVIGDDIYLVWNSGCTTDPEARYHFPNRRSLTRQLNGALVVKAVHRFEM